jgi:O-antigen ligase
MSSALAPSSLKLPATPKKKSLRLDDLILSSAFGLLLFAPLAFGSTEPWSIFVLEASVALIFALWVWRQSATETPVRNNPVFVPMALFAGVVLLQLFFGWTAYRHNTFSQALLYLAYATIVFLVAQCLRRSSQAKTLAVVISVYGVAVASFALLQGLSSNGKLYWIRTPRYGGWIYGPYVNHNSYAGLMEMLVPVPLVFCLTRYAEGRMRTVAAAAAALMAATIFLSGSRGGMVAFLVELIVLAVAIVKEQKGPKLGSAISAFVIITLLLLAWVGGSELTKRVATIATETRAEMTGGTRWTIVQDGLRMFMKKPVLGWGLGTFPTAYPQFRSFYTHFFVNEAHNDYLQFLVETGIVGFGIVIWFVARVYRNGFRKLPDWPNDINGAVSLGCLLGFTGILVHSFVDFNLQVPANAAWFYVLCAVAASPYRLESRQRIRRVRSHLHDPLEHNGPSANREIDGSGQVEI